MILLSYNAYIMKKIDILLLHKEKLLTKNVEFFKIRTHINMYEDKI